MRGTLSLALALSMAMQGSASAQTSADAELLKGINELQAGDLDAAVITLDSAVLRFAAVKGRQQDLGRAYAYLGMAHLGLGRTEDARAKLRLAYAAHPGLQLDPKQFPPTIIQFYEQARREAGAAQASAPKPTPSPVASAPASAQPTVKPAEKKGGAGKIALIVLGGAAVAGVAVAAGGGGGSSSDAPATTQSALTSAGNFRGISGTWRGSLSAGTNQPGGTVSFTVTDDSQISSFSLGIPIYCEHPDGPFGPPPGSVANNTFELRFFSNKAVRGQFTSATAAGGTLVDLRTNGQPGNCNRTWTASKQ